MTLQVRLAAEPGAGLVLARFTCLCHLKVTSACSQPLRRGTFPWPEPTLPDPTLLSPLQGCT